jgi:hypothetical protein
MKSFSIEFNYAIGSFIGALFSRGGPPAVFRAVVAVWVDPVQRVTKRFFSHVFREILGISPSLANIDTSASVQRKIFVLGIPTSSNHPFPYLKGRMPTHSVCITNGRKALFKQAPTGLNAFIFQAGRPRIFVITTITQARPYDSRA